MKKHPDISVIIPAYNAEKTIKSCLDSVMRQDGINDIEVLVVDDCSTDNTAEILHKYQQTYSNIILLSTLRNSGPSVARNIALDKSCGQWVTFIDADDRVGVSWESLHKIYPFDYPYHYAYYRYSQTGTHYRTATEMRNVYTQIQNTTDYFTNMLNNKNASPKYTDVVFGNCITIDPFDRFINVFICDQDEFFCEDFEKNDVLIHANNRASANFALYNRSFLTKHKLRFRPDMNLDEDILFCMQATMRAREVVLANGSTYLYTRQRESACKIASNTKYYDDCRMAYIKRFSILLNDLYKYPHYSDCFAYWVGKFNEFTPPMDVFMKTHSKYTMRDIQRLTAPFPDAICTGCKSDQCFNCVKIRKLIQSNIKKYCQNTK